MPPRRQDKHGNSLKPFQHAVLATVGWMSFDGVSGYAVARAAAPGGSRGLLGYSESQVYREVKNLARLGYLEVREGESRGASVYTLSDEGLAAVRAWVRTELEVPAIGDEELVARFRATAFLLREEVFGEPGAFADRLRNRIEDLRDFRRTAARRGKWDELLELEYDLHVSLLRTYLAWLERVEDQSARRARADGGAPRSLDLNDGDWLGTDDDA